MPMPSDSVYVGHEDGDRSGPSTGRPSRARLTASALMIDYVLKAWSDPSVGVLALTGAGDKAFSSGGDQEQRHETGD